LEVESVDSEFSSRYVRTFDNRFASVAEEACGIVAKLTLVAVHNQVLRFSLGSPTGSNDAVYGVQDDRLSNCELKCYFLLFGTIDLSFLETP
jgi:hypothetical protein